MLIGTAISQFTIEPIKNTVGIYYHDETKITITNDRWTLLIHKNISLLVQTLENNNKILEAIQDTIEPDYHAMNSFRSEVRTHVSLLIQISNSINEKLKGILFDTKRSKRGLINGLGSIFKSITGNLDSTDGEYYTSCINRIKGDQHKIENLFKNQISVTTSVIKTFNSTVQKLSIDEKMFNTNINKIVRAIHQLSDKMALIDAKLKFSEICEKLMASYLYLEDNLNDILDSITFARLKIIHTSIISPDDLILSLKEISQNLVKNNLPLPVKYSTIAQFLDIIELEAFQTQNDLVFVLKIPLVEQYTYTLFHLYPIPVYDNRTGLHHVLSFSKKYLARDDDALMYVPIKDLSICKPLTPYQKLCSNLYAYPIDINAACEAQLFRSYKSIPDNCQSSIIHGQGYNVQKLEDNLWLLIVVEPIHATISCPNHPSKTLIISENSVLKLESSCYAFVGITKIQAESRKVLNVTHNPHSILINYNCCQQIPEQIKLETLKPLELNSLDLDNLNAAKTKLDQYSRDLDGIINKPFVEKNVSILTYISYSLIISLAALYVISKFIKKKKPDASVGSSADRASRSVYQSFQRFIPKRRPDLQDNEKEDI